MQSYNNQNNGKLDFHLMSRVGVMFEMKGKCMKKAKIAKTVFLQHDYFQQMVDIFQTWVNFFHCPKGHSFFYGLTHQLTLSSDIQQMISSNSFCIRLMKEEESAAAKFK